MIRLIALILFFASAAWADETLQPTSTEASDSNTSCNASVHGSLDEGADTPGGDWCTADSNNDNWSFTVGFDTPSGSLDNGTDQQAIELYVQSFDEGQAGVPDIRVDVYDGVACADLHETGTETSLTDAGFPAKVTDTWTSAGISAAADVCFVVVCTKAGGAPGNRNSCNIDAIEWEVKTSAAPARNRIIVVD